MKMELTSIDVKNLTTVVNSCGCDLRRDIHVFVDYCTNYEVKRSHRGNSIPKADSKKLAKLLTDSRASKEVETDGNSAWIEFIDNLALKLELVRYDTEGMYMGYSSTEPSFPDNYIDVRDDKYRMFLESPLAKQEQSILGALVKQSGDGHNEFFRTDVFSKLDRFDTFGCATGVMPTLDFSAIRNFLLHILSTFESGSWFCTESLVSYLKKTHPFFLIPQILNIKSRYDDENKRYGNFVERLGENRYSGKEIVVTEGDPDAFERVEGRYIERFLEGIPLAMGYVDVAYAAPSKSKMFPSIGELKAFRVRDRLLQAMKGDLPEPRMRVQPNFEIYVESDFYPATILSRLKTVAEITKSDKVVILQLKREKVAQIVAKDPGFDVVSFLKTMSGVELPKNVVVELGEWAHQADMFTLYKGFALLEESKELSAADEFTRERISPGFRIVHSPAKLFSKLENEGCMPIHVNHGNSAFKLLPEYVKTIFPRKLPVAKERKQAKPISLKRMTRTTYYFPSEDIFEIFLKSLGEVRCPFESNRGTKSITISEHLSPKMMNVVNELKKTYTITIADVGN